MTREKGVETMPCPNCGNDRPVAEQADGSKVAESCPKCWPTAPEKEKAAHSSHREHGTDTKKED